MEFNKKKSVCVIIPAYNEERGLENCLYTVIKTLTNTNCATVLIVVNDGSTDKTEEILKKMKNKFSDKMAVVTHDKNQGYGAAIQSGIKEAAARGFEFCIFMDSDLTNDPKYIHDFISKISPDVDCIKASRYIPGGNMPGVPFHRKLISKTCNFIARHLFRIGVRDCTNGFRMTRIKLIKDISFKEKDFSIILEELYWLKKNRARFMEIPNILTSRIDTKTHFRYTIRIFWNYMKYALKALFV